MFDMVCFLLNGLTENLTEFSERAYQGFYLVYSLRFLAEHRVVSGGEGEGGPAKSKNVRHGVWNVL